MIATRSSFTPALLIVLALSSPALMAQDCDPSLNFQWRGYPVDMEIDGTTLAIADGAGLTLVDVADPHSPRLLSATVTPAESSSVVFTGMDRLALLTRGELRLYDVEDAQPRLLDAIDVDGVHLHRFGAGLVIVGRDVTTVNVVGDSLAVGPAITLLDDPVASAVVADVLYVSLPGYGTARIDGSLAESGRIGVVATSITGQEDTIFLGRGSDGVFAVDFSNLDRPAVISHLGSGLGADEVLLIDDTLYSAGSGGSLHLVDVSNPAEMVITGVVDAQLDVLTTDGDYLYSYGSDIDRLGRRIETEPYLTVRDLTAGELPVVAALQDSTGPISGVATDGEVAWIADPPFLRAIDLSSGAEIWNLQLDQPFDRVRLESDRLILYGRAWVHLIDPYAETGILLGSWATQGIADGGVTFSGPWLIEANRASGFHVLDISDPSNIYQRGGLINDGRGKWLGAVGMPGVVYGMATRGLKVVALGSDPSAVEIVDFLQYVSITDVEIVTVEGKAYLLVLDANRIHVHDLSAPLHPIPISVIEVVHGTQIAVSGTRAWVLGTDGLVVEIDLANPAAPQFIGVHEGMREGLALDAHGNVLVGADVWSLWANPLTIDVDHSPVLSLTALDDEAAAVHWESPPVSLTEVQVSRTQDFGEIEQSWMTPGEVVRVERSESLLRVRARLIQGCSIGPWSAAIQIEPEREVVGRSRPVRRP